MAQKKKKEIEQNYKEMDVDELERVRDKSKQDLFKLKFRGATAPLKNVMEIRNLRRGIARLNTYITQKRSTR